MTYPTIHLDAGHVLTDNGVGDYDFTCPTGYRRFIPVMLAAVMMGWTCPGCGATGLSVPADSVFGTPPLKEKT